MGTILASALISKAQIIVNDATGVRWPDSEMLGWLNDAQTELVLLKANASVKNASVLMVAGTKQAIPADGVALVAIRRNMGTSGTAPGTVVTQVDMTLLDEQDRSWHYGEESGAAIHYVFDPQDPKHFYLYPPQPATPHQMEMVYSCVPTVIAATTDPISLDDIYQNILVDYMIYRAFSKDVDYAANDGRAGIHYQRFVAALGVKISEERGRS